MDFDNTTDEEKQLYYMDNEIYQQNLIDLQKKIEAQLLLKGEKENGKIHKGRSRDIC